MTMTKNNTDKKIYPTNKNNQETKMGRKISALHISIDQQAKSQTRKLGLGLERERNWISSDRSTKQRPKDKYVKAKTDTTQQKSRCRLCCNRDETINQITSKYSYYKTRYDCVGNLIQWKLCKKFKSEITNKWYIHNPEFV